jgi:hypothetical protein
MEREEVAPPYETWPEHLKALANEDLTDLAADYCWLTEKNRPEDEREEFRQRREAIIAECERRGMPDAAKDCVPPPQ